MAAQFALSSPPYFFPSPSCMSCCIFSSMSGESWKLSSCFVMDFPRLGKEFCRRRGVAFSGASSSLAPLFRAMWATVARRLRMGGMDAVWGCLPPSACSSSSLTGRPNMKLMESWVGEAVMLDAGLRQSSILVMEPSLLDRSVLISEGNLSLSNKCCGTGVSDSSSSSSSLSSSCCFSSSSSSLFCSLRDFLGTIGGVEDM